MEKSITLQLKRLGKKKIKTISVLVDKTPETLKELIEECVKSEITRYNRKREDVLLLPFLSPSEIQEQSESGKIGFGEIENKELAQADKAAANALLAFQDGLFAVFVEDREVNGIDEKININETTAITFVRLTFLAGTYW